MIERSSWPTVEYMQKIIDRHNTGKVNLQTSLAESPHGDLFTVPVVVRHDDLFSMRTYQFFTDVKFIHSFD